MSPKRETSPNTIEIPEIVFPAADSTNPYAVFFNESDQSKSNPGLHLLYVKWAVMHLTAIDEMLAKLSNFSNANMHGPYAMLLDARTMLVNTNLAYADAADMLTASKGIDPTAPARPGVLINDDIED